MLNKLNRLLSSPLSSLSAQAQQAITLVTHIPISLAFVLDGYSTAQGFYAEICNLIESILFKFCLFQKAKGSINESSYNIHEKYVNLLFLVFIMIGMNYYLPI